MSACFCLGPDQGITSGPGAIAAASRWRQASRRKQAEYMTAPERFAEKSDSLLHRGRRPYMTHHDILAGSFAVVHNIASLSGDGVVGCGYRSWGRSMRRREFITLIGGTAALSLIRQPLQAQQQPAMPVIGWLGATSPKSGAAVVETFLRGLSEVG